MVNAPDAVQCAFHVDRGRVRRTGRCPAQRDHGGARGAIGRRKDAELRSPRVHRVVHGRAVGQPEVTLGVRIDRHRRIPPRIPRQVCVHRLAQRERVAAVVRDVDLAALPAPRCAAGVVGIDLVRSCGPRPGGRHAGSRSMWHRTPAGWSPSSWRHCLSYDGTGVRRCPGHVVAGRDDQAAHVALACRGAGGQRRERRPAIAAVAGPEALGRMAVGVVDARGGDVRRIGPRHVGRRCSTCSTGLSSASSRDPY